MLDAGANGILFCSECPEGFFGVNCRKQCNCKNEANCDGVTGECICLPGWFGPSCTEGKNSGHI